MKISEILTPSFKSCRRGALVVPTVDSDFCLEVVAKGWLTAEQMSHAAQRYRLGRSRSGRAIFWMIDELGFVRDGHIGNAWASAMLKQREPELLKDWHTERCLFGMHLVNENVNVNENENVNENVNVSGNQRQDGDGNWPVGIVEKETSAVVLSELYPDYIWMATSCPLYFTIDRLEPLKGRHVVVFPPTDPLMNSYITWIELVDQARQAYHLDITVSALLEDNATSEQKERRIDLASFVLE